MAGVRHGVAAHGWWIAGEGARREPAVNTTGDPWLAAANVMAVSSGPTPIPESIVQEPPRGRFRQTLARVMAVQVISLALLWWLQAHYGR